MKKFDLRGVKGVFGNLLGSEKSNSKGDLEVQETLQPHDFLCGKVSDYPSECESLTGGRSDALVRRRISN